jgi:hypothetical protein
MYSEYPGISGKSLPGDLIVEFSSFNQTSDFPLWIIVVLFFAALLLVATFQIKRKKNSI